MLRELARNLLHNAIQHSPHGAPLQVHLRNTPNGTYFRISDWGRGVSEEMQSKLAEPFVTANPQGGSGLGLAICQSITIALRAQLHLHNRMQNGNIEGFDAVVEFAPDATIHPSTHHGKP